MSKPNSTSRRKSAKSMGDGSVNPIDYEIEEPPRWEPPSWLLDFARDEVWPLLDSLGKAAKGALARWLGSQTHTDERVRQYAMLENEQRRLGCISGTEEMRRLLVEQLEKKVSSLTSASNESPVNLPLPPPSGRILDGDSSLAGLMALNDETRDPSQRIGPSDFGLYSALCARVHDLKRKDLPALRTMLKTARRRKRSDVPPKDDTQTARPQAALAVATDSVHGEDDTSKLLDSNFIDSFSSSKQRDLLKSLHKKGNVLIRDVLLAVYGTHSDSNLVALKKMITRTNEKLCKKNLSLEISQEGKTLILTFDE